MKFTIKRPSSLAGFVLAVISLLILIPLAAHGQELRGKISGRVTDPNGGVIPGATVKVVDVARNATTTFTTNDEGLFDAPYLSPGKYRVLVEIAGFKKYLQDNVVVQINETRKLDIILAIGAPEETVTVTTEAPPINVSDPNLGQTIDRKRVDELPSVHGDPYYLINLTPGVAYTGSTRLDRPFEPTHIANFAMGGARGIRSDLLIDGAPSTATANANEVIASYVPPTDSTQEFRVQTSTYDAQFGNTEGGVTSIVTKGGTNKFHGTGYMWLEPGWMTANDFFGNSRGVGRPFTYSNRPGFSIGGPVTIPKVYDGKNKTFFFFSFEQIADSRPRFDATNIWAPTPALLNGDFSAYLPANCSSPDKSHVCIFDPLTGTFSGGNVTNRTPFAGNIIPAARINPVARAVATYLGSPKGAAAAGAILNNNLADTTLAETLNPPYRNYTIRLDQNIGDKNKLFGRYSWYNRKSTYNNYTSTIYVGDRFLFISKQAVVDGVHTFNASTVLNLRYGFNRFIRGSDAPEGQYGLDLTTLKFPAAFNNAIGEGIRRFPRFDFSSTGSTGAPVGNGHTNEFRPVGSHFVTAVINRSQGIHSLKFGGEMRIYREDDSFKSNNQSGQFSFDNTYTRPNSTSTNGNDLEGLQAWAAFLLGYPSTTSIVRAADYSEYSKTWGFFGQDDVRISRKLTMNLGLRWEFESPLTERQNKSISGFDLTYSQPFEGQAQTNFGLISGTDVLRTTYGLSNITAKGGLLFAGKDTGSGLYNTPKNGFLPRIGFAYQLNPKTVFRGGFGLYQGFLGERRGDVFQPGYSQTTNQPLTTGPNGAPLPYSLSDPFCLSNPAVCAASGITPVSGNTLGKQTALGQTVTFFNQNPKVAKQARWSIGFQRELGRGWVVEGSYVGDRGSNIEITRNLNAVPDKFLNTDNSVTQAMALNNSNLGGTVRSPFCNTVSGSTCTAALYTGAGGTISRRTLLTPFPEFGAINSTNNDGSSSYHSLQVSMDKRFAKGYGLNFAYTRSKWIESTEYLNAGDAQPNKAIAAQDIPNRFSMSGFYEFPFGRGRQFLSGINKWVDVVVGGWQLEGAYSYQSGFPIRFASDAFYLGGKISIPKSQQTVARWFNTSAFVNTLNGNPTCKNATGGDVTAASCATPSDHLRTLPFYFADVRSDPTNNADLGVAKNINVREGMRIQVRLEFINAFNHPLLNTGGLSNSQVVVNPSSATFGQTVSSNQQNYARRAQFMVKFIF
jgi:hypothetical protein